MTASTEEYNFLSPPEAADEIGRLGSYRVLELIGEGGMGKVFLAEDQRLQRKVALKVMSNRIAASKNARQRFIREARAQAAIHHDNVATIFEVDQQNNTPFLAMELLKGQSLEQVLRKGYKFNVRQVISLARQIARGLDAAHQQGIVHRDIKPANIWIEVDKGRPKILDFGLAAMTGPADTLSRRGAVVGTPGYLAPEQARDEPVDDRADIYSLGIVLYEMFGGVLPFRCGNVAMMLIAISCHAPRSLKEFVPDIPEGISDLVDRMLSKEPRDRPASAAELVKELKIVGNEASSEASNDSDSISISVGSLDNNLSSGKAPLTKATSRKNVPILAIAGTGVALLIGVAALAFWPNGDPKPTPENQVVRPVLPRTRTPPVVITPEMLKPLVFEDVAPAIKKVEVGNLAVIDFHIVNTAANQANDPKQTTAKATVAAQVRVYIKPEKSSAFRAADDTPVRMAPARLPDGLSGKIQSAFGTDNLKPGNYDVELRLLTPTGEPVNTANTQFQIVAAKAAVEAIK